MVACSHKYFDGEIDGEIFAINDGSKNHSLVAVGLSSIFLIILEIVVANQVV